MKFTDFSIGKLLETAIRSSNLSISKIAKLSGVNKGTIENWLYGNVMPSIDKAEKIFTALGYEIKIQKLLGEDV